MTDENVCGASVEWYWRRGWEGTIRRRTCPSATLSITSHVHWHGTHSAESDFLLITEPENSKMPTLHTQTESTKRQFSPSIPVGQTWRRLSGKNLKHISHPFCMFEICKQKVEVKLIMYVFHEYITQENVLKNIIKGYLFKHGWLDVINLSLPLDLKRGFIQRNREQHILYTYSTMTLKQHCLFASCNNYTATTWSSQKGNTTICYTL